MAVEPTDSCAEPRKDPELAVEVCFVKGPEEPDDVHVYTCSEDSQKPFPVDGPAIGPESTQTTCMYE